MILCPYVMVLPCQHILHRKRFLNLVKAMLGFFGVETCGKKDLYLFVFFGFLLPQSDRGFKWKENVGCKGSIILGVLVDQFVPNTLLLYPLRISKNFTVFWCFQGVEKGCIGNKWVKTTKTYKCLRTTFRSWSFCWKTTH